MIRKTFTHKIRGTKCCTYLIYNFIVGSPATKNVRFGLDGNGLADQINRKGAWGQVQFRPCGWNWGRGGFSDSRSLPA